MVQFSRDRFIIIIVANKRKGWYTDYRGILYSWIVRIEQPNIRNL